jgi:AGCS family alanine or glycine:cation symporter
MDEDNEPITAPLKLIVIWLIAGGLFFTVFMRFINFRGFRHAIGLIQGKYDNPSDKGEVSHFQALTTALSATVGLGNIAGVAIAITIGGPGATFWMIVAGLIGMSSKFVECTLGVKYRKINADGEVSGGAMYYLKYGLQNQGMKWLGIVLAFVFAIMLIGGALGGGNMFQSNQAFKQFEVFFPFMQNHGVWYGIGLAVLVGAVIIG